MGRCSFNRARSIAEGGGEMNEFASFGFFRGLRPQHLSLLLRCMTRRKLDPGDEVFSNPQSPGKVYLIKRGRIALMSKRRDQRQSSFKVLGPGDALNPSEEHVSSAIVLGPTEALVIDVPSLIELACQLPVFPDDLTNRLARFSSPPDPRRFQNSEMTVAF